MLTLFVFALLCCQVSCTVLVNVTREVRDEFAYPRISSDCSGLCLGKKANVYKDLVIKFHICICRCQYGYSFVAAELKCVANEVIRNTSGPLIFKLLKTEQANGRLYISQFSSFTTTILFYTPPSYKNCQLNDIEELGHQNYMQWNSVKNFLRKARFFELDDDDIEKKYTWIHISYEGWFLLTLNWTIDTKRFEGRIMRINVTCQSTRTRTRNRKRIKLTSITGLMVFKVNGTFRVPDNSFATSTVIPALSTTYQLSPSLSTPTESSVIVASTTSMVPSTTMTSIPSTMITSSSLIPMTSSSLIQMTSSSLTQMTSSSVVLMTSSSVIPMTSSALAPMTSSIFIPMTSSPLVPMTSPTTVKSESSRVETQSLTRSLTSSSMVFSSSSPVVPLNPEKSSDSPSVAAVTGGVVAGVVLLLLCVVLLLYVLRKRRRKVIKSRADSDLGYLNAGVGSVTHLPAMSNPLNDGVYENPEVVTDGSNRRSGGALAIDSAAYDACLVVENPSAREVKSVYDNIPDPQENTYKALDPTKREPSVKYQSLIRNDHEYSTVADTVSGEAIQEPLYSEIDVKPPAVYVNGGPHAPTLPPFTSRKPPNSAVAEPIYNELENSDKQPAENAEPTPPPLAPRKSPSPRKSPTPVEGEVIYNELEDDRNQEQGGEEPNEVTNDLEESTMTDEPHYAVLEEK